MKKQWIRNFFLPIKVVCLLMVLCIAGTTSNVIEVSLQNTNINKTIDLTVMANKLEEDIKSDLYSAKDTYVGDLTGYTADCPLCSGRLACKSDYYVLDGTENYMDDQYGNVRIVASSRNLACGTIIRFQKDSVSNEPIIAIVLDRGVLGNDIDLLTRSNEYANTYIGRSVIQYDVLRNGWSNN